MTALFSAFGVHCEHWDINSACSGAQVSLKEPSDLALPIERN